MLAPGSKLGPYEAPDGRILVTERFPGSTGPQARLLTNWTAKLDVK